MRTVYKIDVPVDGKTHDLPMPLGGRIVHVACQGSAIDTVTAWFECESTEIRQDRRFVVHGTGHPVNEHPDPKVSIVHVGTAVTQSGLYVWHLFEHVTLGRITFPSPAEAMYPLGRTAEEEVAFLRTIDDGEAADRLEATLGQSQPDPRREPAPLVDVLLDDGGHVTVDLRDTDVGLLTALRELGDRFGPAGVANAAAQLAGR